MLSLFTFKVVNDDAFFARLNYVKRWLLSCTTMNREDCNYVPLFISLLRR